MSKVILILLDACTDETAAACAGYIEHLVEEKKGARYHVRGGLPSLSRPMYESMLTGLDVTEHGILNNGYTRPSNCENLFSLTTKNGKTNAAAAYGWISELYNQNGPFDLNNHRIQFNTQTDIQNGIFYCKDDYPDSHLIADGEALRQMYHPDFIFMHSMNVDFQGHRNGSGTKEYNGAVMGVFDTIASLIDTWIQDGYDVLITADHGMDAFGMHGGTTDIQRNTPLYIFSSKVKPGNFKNEIISNLNVAPLVCKLLEIPAGEKMMKNLEIKFN